MYFRNNDFYCTAKRRLQYETKHVVQHTNMNKLHNAFAILLKRRTIFVSGEINDKNSDAVVGQLLLLDTQRLDQDLKLFINSPGGSVTAGMAIYDSMTVVNETIQTVCFGLAASMGAFILGAGEPSKRYSMLNSRIMIHQPIGGISGAAVDVEIQAREIMYHKTTLNRIMSNYTGQSLQKIEDDTDRDRYMSPIEAKKYGIIDQIISGKNARRRNSNRVNSAVKMKKDYISWGREERYASQKLRFKKKPVEP